MRSSKALENLKKFSSLIRVLILGASPLVLAAVAMAQSAPAFSNPADLRYGYYTPGLIGSAPAATYFQGKEAVAYLSGTGSGQVCLAISSGPINCLSSFPTSDGAPQITVWNQKIYIAYAAVSSHQLILASTSDGYNFGLTEPSGVYVAPSPAITTFNGKLWIAYQENQHDHYLGLASSSDGNTFSNGLYSQYPIGHSPAATTFNNQLVITYFANHENHYLDILRTDGNGNFYFAEDTGASLSNLSVPTALSRNGILYIGYVNNGTNNLYTVYTRDGITVSAPTNSTADDNILRGGPSFFTDGTHFFAGVWVYQNAYSNDKEFATAQTNFLQ